MYSFINQVLQCLNQCHAFYAQFVLSLGLQVVVIQSSRNMQQRSDCLCLICAVHMYCITYAYKIVSCAGSTAVSLYQYGAHDFAVQTPGIKGNAKHVHHDEPVECCSLGTLTLLPSVCSILHCKYHWHASDVAKDLHIFNTVASD